MGTGLKEGGMGRPDKKQDWLDAAETHPRHQGFGEAATGPDSSMPDPGGISEASLLDASGILGTNPNAEDMPGDEDVEAEADEAA
jgi:hypothetical protein